jgi:hypoxanthine phosphoribosyltransferase
MAGHAAAPAVKPLFSAEQIAGRVDELARELAALPCNDLIIVSVLKGSVRFAEDLVRALSHLGIRPKLDFLELASYGDDTRSSGKVEIVRDLEITLAGRDVMIADDILDSGCTLSCAKTLIESRGARTVRTCVLLDKQVKRAVEIVPDFVGFPCPPVYVVGYGMDLAGRYRELPFIGEVATPRSE